MEEHPAIRKYKNALTGQLLREKEEGVGIIVSSEVDTRLDPQEYQLPRGYGGVHILLKHPTPSRNALIPARIMGAVREHKKQATEMGWGLQTSTGTTREGETTCKVTVLSIDHKSLEAFRKQLEKALGRK